MTSRSAARITGNLLVTALACVLLAQCSHAPSKDVECVGTSCDVPFDGSPPDEYVHDAPSADSGLQDGAAIGNLLCGQMTTCKPDNPDACPPIRESALDASVSDAKPSADGASVADASKADASTKPDGSRDASFDFDASGIADGGERALGCVVELGSAGPESSCRSVGSGGIAAPCVTSKDCGPGLACVGDAEEGQCRPYCCGGAEACIEGSFCQERSLREHADGGPALSVPVCMVADQCSLAQPYPCPEELRSKGSCTCPEPGTACKVVRRDGTTSCVSPGSGVAGGDCPCAWNHICSQATGKCLKVCSVDHELECAGGKCQASASLPGGFGVCVGEVVSD